MHNPFNKNKRKSYEDSSEGRDRSSKHSKFNDNDFSKSSNALGNGFNDASRKTSSSDLSGSPTARKLAALLRSLEDVLDEEGLDEEILSRCTDLRSSLLNKKIVGKSINDSPVSRPKSSQPSAAIESQKLPKVVSYLAVTPWKASTISNSLPKLPEILDPTLAAAVFIHHSLGGGSVTDLSYERLEWVGDAYIELIATLLIAQTFPVLNPGKASQYREGLVKNVTLAGYARQYGFDKRIRFAPTLSRPQGSEMIKIQGDVFESYVAAVILSDPVNGIHHAVDWLKELWGQKLHSDIIYEERTNFKYDSPLWRLRGDKAEVTVVDKTQGRPLLFKEVLQKSIGAKGIRLRYEDVGSPVKSRETKLAEFTVGIYLDGWGEQGRLLGTGKGYGKKEAGERAAEMAMQNKQLIESYMEMKKKAVAQAELERQALEQHNPAA